MLDLTSRWPLLSRQQTAQRQLDSAIRDLFLYGDLISAHLLAWAALDVITDVAKATRKSTIRTLMRKHMSDALAKAWIKAERDHYNFMKHADRDPHRRVSLIPEMSAFALYIACRDFLKIFGETSALMATYSAWYLGRTPLMKSSFGDSWDEVLSEGLGGSDEEAWAEAVELVRFAVENPSAIAAVQAATTTSV